MRGCDRRLFPLPGSRPCAACCPACGKGRLFAGYLKQAPACTDCGAATGGIDAGDGPLWIRLAGLGTFAVGAVLIALSRIKGGLIGALWGMRPPA